MQQIVASDTSAPGQYFGFSVQPARMCLQLIRSQRGSQVGLEVLDDIDIIAPDGTVTLEQIKSGLVSNPISDWSTDLWKTFSNWIDLIEDGKVEIEKTKFCLYVVQHKSGDIAQNLRAAHTPSQALQVIAKIRAAYHEKKPEGCKAYIERFLAYDEDKLVKLVVNFDLQLGDNDIIEGIRSYMAGNVPDPSVDDACRAAVGWVKEVTDLLISNRKLARILKSDFGEWYSRYISNVQFDGYKRFTLPAPSEEEVSTGMATAHVMLKQLDLIEMGHEQLEAMSNFLRAKTNKVAWAERGLVFAQDILDFEKELVGKWRRANLEVRMGFPAHPEIDRGQLLHGRCMDWEMGIGGVPMEHFMVRGSLHQSANAKTIGWHPNYKELLEGE